MLITHHYLAATFLGLTAILTVGCDNNSTAPVTPATGAIEITVSTSSADTDLDPDGYRLSIDGGPGPAVGANATVTIANLRVGNHIVRLYGVAPNCSVAGSIERQVEVTTDKAASPISFSVSCQPTEYEPWDY